MSDILDVCVLKEIKSHLNQEIKISHKCLIDDNRYKAFVLTEDDNVWVSTITDTNVNELQIIPKLCHQNIQQFFSGNLPRKGFVLALSSDGQLYGWGRNDLGQLGTGSTSDIIEYLKPEKVSLNLEENERIIKIVCGSDPTLVLTSERNVYGWGDNRFGQIGCGEKNEFEPIILSPTKIFPRLSIKSVHCCDRQSFALTYDDVVYIWGNIRHSDDYFWTYWKFLCRSLGLQTIKISDEIPEGICFSNYITYSDIRNATNETSIVRCDNHNEVIFKEDSELGRGSFGTVYKVINKLHKKKFAIKKIILNNGEERQKHLREVEILSKCSPEYVVQCFNSWIELKIEENGRKIETLFIQMELGYCNLDVIIKRIKGFFGNQSTEQNNGLKLISLILLFEESLKGVQYLHHNSIIHRDLKPVNIIFVCHPRHVSVKICDFGLSKLAGTAAIEAHSKDIGPRKYSAPEVTSGHYTHKADIYSCGQMARFDMFNDFIKPILQPKPKLIIESEKLKKKWMALKKRISLMVANDVNKRPDANEILSESNLWSLTENDSDLIELIKQVLNTAKDVNGLYEFLMQKFLTLNIEPKNE